MAENLTPLSCDTFVALSPATENGMIIFGKNSDRPRSEVQEFIYCPAADHPAGSKLKCTYIEVDQVAHTHAVALSKPAWIWGAEMGANEHGVCIGNEAVFTKLQGPQDSEEKLLGMDLLRLGLERSESAEKAVEVIGELLQQHGQGGLCFEEVERQHFTYHNSFLIADRSEAWVMETAGQFWAATRITSGVYNISNLLTITTEIDAMSPGLKEHAEKNGYWNAEDGPFNFAKAYTSQPDKIFSDPKSQPEHRWEHGKQLLQKYAEGGKFTLSSMLQLLRDKPSGINAVRDKEITTGSQVSVLTPAASKTLCCHWFTATPAPDMAFFKPFVFSPNVKIGELTKSPEYGDKDPVCLSPRFQTRVDRQHPLYSAHAAAMKKTPEKLATLLTALHKLEEDCIKEMEEFLQREDPVKAEDLADIFQYCVESEMIVWK